MVGEGAGDDTTGGHGGYPDIGNAAKINARGNRAIPPGPSETREVRMQISPNINDASCIEEGHKTS